MAQYACSAGMYGVQITQSKDIKFLPVQRVYKLKLFFLQETHIKHMARALIRPVWAAQVYQANFSTKTRGVAIIIKKQVPFIHKQTISDPSGRYIIVIGEINSVDVTLINVYGPNYDDTLFFKEIIESISDLTLSITGDYNCVLNSSKDAHPS